MKKIMEPPKGLLEMPIDLTPNGKMILERRYLRRGDDGKPNETIPQLFWRVASVVAAKNDVKIAEEYYRMMAELKFLPNSPTLTGAGTRLGQLAACFVLPIDDDMGKDSGAGIFNTLRDAALIQQTGGGVGFSFSRLRPKGDIVNSSGGSASGPISFLKVYDAAFGAIAQGGIRRGANMGVLRVDHPDIEEFIGCKYKEGVLTNFNLSIGITDDFMKAVMSDSDFTLINPHTGKPTKTLKAKDLFASIVAHAHANGEPGVLFLDTANIDNPVPNLYKLEASNPCGEQWLGPYESCCLGSINLAKFIDAKRKMVYWDELAKIIHIATKFLDDVIDINAFVPSVPKLKEAAYAVRRIGLGIMGLADALYYMRIGYGTPECVELCLSLMEFVRYHSMMESIELARERGSFPAIKGSIYDPENLKWIPKTKTIESTLRPELDWSIVVDRIKKYGIRNGAQTTIAPTGTIGNVAGCEGCGCEPVFALAYTRKVKGDTKDDTLTYVSPAFLAALDEHGIVGDIRTSIVDRVIETGSCQGIETLPKEIKNVFVVSGDITPICHVMVQAALQTFVDNSISKTINMPIGTTVDEVKSTIISAWQRSCKGLTIYVTGSRSDVVLETKAQTSVVTTVPQERSATPFLEKRPRPKFLHGITYRSDTPLGEAYITVNNTEDGEPFEVFLNVGKGGSDLSSVSEALGRLISLNLRIPSLLSPTQRLEQIVAQMEDIGGRNHRGLGKNRIISMPDSVAKVLKEHLGKVPSKDAATEAQTSQYDLCPDCGNSSLVNAEGCRKCIICGRSEC